MLPSAFRDLGSMLASPPLVLTLVLNGALAVAFVVYAWPRRGLPGARSFVALNVFAAITSWAYAAFLQADDPATRAFWSQVRLLANAGMPVAFLTLGLETTGRAHWLSRTRLAALVVVPVLNGLLILTNPWHRLVVRSTADADSPVTAILGGDAGPAIWVTLVFAGATAITGVVLLIEQAIRRRGVARSQALMLLGALVIPALSSIASVIGLAGDGLLLGPFAYGISMVLFAFAVFRRGFLDIVPVAREAVFEQMSQGVIVLDDLRRVVDANAAAATLLGRAGRLVGRTAGELLGEWPPVVAALEGNDSATVEIMSGAAHLQVIVTPLRAGAGHLVIAHDVTDARRTEAALQEASRARGDFLARMSHEIRTPMNGVIGLSGLLLQTPLDGRQQEYARGVRQSAQALLRLVNDVLDFSRIDAGRLDLEVSHFEPRAVVAEAVALVRPEAGAKGLTLETSVDAAVPFTVAGDVGRVRQVLINLLGNAVKFTTTGGIQVDLAVADAAPADDLGLRFRVRDTGVGIAPDAIARIFDPFVQADAATATRFGGSGLGLAISRQLVDLMGGTIDVASGVGRGTTFDVIVPVARADAITSVSPAARDTGDVAPGRRWAGRVLVAEDNTVNQLVIVRMLEARGLVADVAATGKEAVEAWARVPYDLVLMDCRMPDVDGYEATREIRRRERGERRTPIVAMTAAALPAERQRSFDAGMDEHVAKPVRALDLEAVLDRFLPGTDRPTPAAAPPDLLAEIRAAMGSAFGDVVRQYLADADTSLAAMRDAAASGDHAAVEAIAHRLKGSSGVVAATDVARLCQQIVDTPAEPAPRLDELARELTAVRARLLAAVKSVE